MPRDHVLTKTFYLLDRLVGRTAVGQTWIEALPPADSNDKGRPARAGDGVSPIIIASDDLAAAWASDAEGGPLYPLIPGGRPPARARLPQRDQSRDVHAHRQLQGRSGPREGHHRKAHPLSVWSIAFSPFLPPWAIVALAAAALAITIVLVWRRVRGAWLRALAFALLILGLCDPNLVQENRRPLKDIVAVVVDRSASQDIGERPGQTDKARDEREGAAQRARRRRSARRRNLAPGIGHRGHQALLRAARGALGRAAGAGRRRDHDHRRRRARHSRDRRRARLRRARCMR